MTITALLQENVLSFPSLHIEEELGCLEVTGSDAIKFLQGQSSCDFTLLTETRSLFGAFCNVKGRVITNFYATLNKQNILLIMSHDLLAKTLSHLQKYAVFFNVKMSDVSAHYNIHHYFSEDSIFDLSDSFFNTLSSNEATLIEINKMPIKQAMLVSQKEVQNAVLVDELNSLSLSKLDTNNHAMHKKDALTMLSGQPLISEATSEKFIPQMLNMQLTQGVSFKKGCYTGQEIVALMQYRGNLKKRAYLFSYDNKESTEAPASLTKLINPDGREVGDIIASKNLLERTFLLAVIGDEDANKTVLLANQEVKKESLPYSTIE